MNLPAEQVYLFRHAVLRQAAYQLQPPLQRARIHELALEILESLPGTGSPAFALELAEHAAFAADGAPEDRAAILREKHLRYLATGADHARFNYDYAAAESALHRLFALAATDPERRMMAADMLADLCQRQGRHAQARQWFEQVVDHGTSDIYRGRARIHLAWQALEQGDFAQAERHAVRGEALNAKSPDPRLTIAWMLYHARHHALSGRHDEASERQRAALELAESTGDWIQAAISHLNLAEAMSAMGRLDDAMLHLDSAESHVQKPTAENWRAQVALGRADVLRLQGRHAEALAALDRVYRFARSTGSMGLYATVLIRRAQVLEEQGQTTAALREATHAAAIATEIGDEVNLAMAKRFGAE